MAEVMHLDYETRSTCDLQKCGLSVYSKDPGTDIWCAAYSFGDGPVKLWMPVMGMCPREIEDHVNSGGEVYAHNAAFEIAITNEIASKRYGWPIIRTSQVHCTMAMAFSMAVPGSLEKAAAAMGISKQKDMAGSRLMIQMAQPRDVSTEGVITWWDAPDKLDALCKYCIQDVEVERELTKRLLVLSPLEREIWAMDQEINNRGIMLDVEATRNAIKLVDVEKLRLDDEMRRITKNQVASCKAVKQITDFLKFNFSLDFSLQVDTLAKSDVVELLDVEGIPKLAKDILTLRQMAAKSSNAKLEAMLHGADSDNRIRGCFQYSGATTRRWAGRRVQFQNLPRPTLPKGDINEILDLLHEDKITASEIDVFYGPVLNVISDCIRGFLRAPEGKLFIQNDFNAIEARVLAWLAGQESTLEIFRKGGDVYVYQASGIYRVKENEVTEDQRQIGKVAILALGYQGGVVAFQSMAKKYNVKVSEGEAKSIKYAWRDANGAIVKYWYDLENAARSAILNPGKQYRVGAKGREVTYLVRGSFLWCRLPSNGILCYPYPKVASVTTPWGASKEGVTFMTENAKTKKWERDKTYGGSLCENITQSVARDLLAEAMLRLRKENIDIVLHVHDEVVCEVPKEWASEFYKKKIEKIMLDSPAWAKDLPMAVGGWIAERFKK